MAITNGINEYCKPTDYFWGLIMNQIQTCVFHVNPLPMWGHGPFILDSKKYYSALKNMSS